MPDPVLTTPRLRLTPLERSDAGDLFEYRSDPAVCRYQSFAPQSLGEVEKFIDGLRSVAFGTAGTWFQFGIRLLADGRLIGDVGLHFSAEDRRQVEVGISVAPANQGRGVGTEAIIGVTDYIFGPLGMHRVYASVDPRNTASVALLKRVGLRQEAHFRQSLWFKGEWVDDLVFGLLASEWKNRLEANIPEENKT